MKNAFLLLFILIAGYSKITAQFIYVNPKPGSANHRPEITIALNPGSDVDPLYLSQPDLFFINGSKSGNHTFKIILSADGHTIILKPLIPFIHGENVTVTAGDGIKTLDEKSINGTTFSFSIISQEPSASSQQKLQSDDPVGRYQQDQPTAEKITNFPLFTISVNNNPAPGSFFFCNKNDDFFNISYLTILNNDASFDYSELNNNVPNDWKMNDNCMFTYYDQVNVKWLMLDTSFNLLDSFQCGNGLEEYTNAHEFRIWPDGHAYIEAYDEQIIDMSLYVPGGDTAAVVSGFTVQRLDADHNVVFEWRSWDYFQFTDAVIQTPLTQHFVDPVHGNSIEEDFDGNLIFSERHMSEITKVNANTGDIMWRMGGENNEFTFVNDIDTVPFYYQHYVRRLPNGHILFFNNNNYQVPPESSAKEYSLDEITKVATLEWHYTHPFTNGQPVYGRAGGSAQRLSNGNTVICWGYANNYSSNPTFTEIDSSGNIVFEFMFDDSTQYNYRTTKHIWQTCDGVATGIAASAPDAAIIISPNPSSGDFSLSFTGFSNSKISFEIQNILGEVIYFDHISQENTNTPISLSLKLAAGLYFCSVKGGNKNLSEKILVQ